MKVIDAMKKACPIPVVEAKKALVDRGEDSILIKVDNFVAVQNLEKLANNYEYSFSYVENAKDSYDVSISKEGGLPQDSKAIDKVSETVGESSSNGVAVFISRNTMGEGSEELGKILIKGFIYSLTELSAPPKCVVFFNSGAFLTSDDANTIDDLKKLEEKGTEILTCGTCINFYGLQDKLAVGKIANMYEITERMAAPGNIINI